MNKFETGFENCDTPYDLGWKHGTEDCHDISYEFRPDCPLTFDEMEDYKDGYREAKRGWD